jgi:hypothetical protein
MFGDMTEEKRAEWLRNHPASFFPFSAAIAHASLPAPPYEHSIPPVSALSAELVTTMLTE